MSYRTRKIIVILGLILICIILVNINADKAFVHDTRIFSPFLLSEINKDAFDSLENMRMFISAKLAFDPLFKFLLLGIFMSITVMVIFFLIKRKKKDKESEFEEIFRKVSLVLDETVDSGKRDQTGKIIFEEVKIMPELDFSKLNEEHSFLIKNVPLKLEKNLNTYINGLLILLKEANYIEIDEGMLKATGFPGQFRVDLLSPELKKRQRLESVFNKAGLYFKERVGEKDILIYPQIKEEENGDLIVDVSRVNITRHQLQNALAIISKEYNKNYLFVEEVNHTIYKIHCSKPASLPIPKGQSIVNNVDIWRDGVVEHLKEKWANEKQFYWYFGDLRDSSYTMTSNEMIISGDDLIHAMIIGTSGSGKSESVKTICATLQAAYEDKIEIYYANGAQSTDLDVLCSSYSPIGKEAAKPYGITEDEMLARLLHILSNAETMKEQRDTLFKEAFETYGIECKKIVEYRQITGDDIPEILIVIDEFAGYSLLFDYDASVNTVGSVAYYLQTGFSQYRKFGIHFLIATQEMKAKSIPRRLFSNIKGGIIMKVVETDFKYMQDNLEFNFEGLDPIKFAKGDGMFFNDTLHCSVTGRTRIPVSMPFIGSNTMDLVNIIGNKIDPKKKKDYDISILNLEEKDLTLNGLEGKQKKLQTVIEKCFLLREKWTIIGKENPTHRIMNLYAVHEGTSEGVLEGKKTIRIAFTNVDDVLSSNFDERLERENTKSADLTIYFITSKTSPKNMDDLKNILESDNASLCLFQNEFTPAIREAYEAYKAKDNTEVFNKLLNSIEFRNHLRAKKELDELYSSKISHGIVTVAMLNRIRKQEGAAKKGESFEDLFLAIEAADNHDSIHGRELTLKGIVNLKLANAQADGGLDIVRWIDREKKICLGFQLKNQMSRSLSTDVVDKMVKTRNLYTELGLTFKSFFLITTGEITRQARDEAEKMGFVVVNGKQLDSIILSMEANAKIKIEDFDQRQPLPKDLPGGKLLREPVEFSKKDLLSLKPRDIDLTPIKRTIETVEDDDGELGSLEIIDNDEIEIDDGEFLQKDISEKVDPILAAPLKGGHKTAQLGIKYPDRSSFMKSYSSLQELNEVSHKKRSMFNDLAFEFLKLSGYDVKRTSEMTDIPKSVITSYPFIYSIDGNKIGIVTVRNNVTRGLGMEHIRPLMDHLNLIENAGYKVVRKEMYLSGVIFTATKKELESEGFMIFDGSAYIEEIKRAYSRLEIVEGSKT
jgi:hypothetical protein